MGFNNDEKRELNILLQECKNAAKEGIQVVEENQKEINQIAKNIGNVVDDLNFSLSSIKLPKECYQYRNELKAVQQRLMSLDLQMKKDFKTYKERIENFSITVFGKTMVGKSTLMEVLTNGDGKSIGKGSQRTTRDVRSYLWKETGIKFTDVPGIGSAKSGGDNDSKLAFNEAQYADLILFLITDDGPQEEEAAGLAQIKEMGKPVICILNVKSYSSQQNCSNKFRLRKIKKRMSDEGLKEIKQQFLSYASKYGQNWEDIPFFYTDLHAEWLSQQDMNKQESNELHELSQFELITKAIIEQVRQKGSFYQYKTLIDIIYKSSKEAYDELLKQYVSSIAMIKMIDEQKNKLATIKRNFEVSSQNQIQSCLNRITNDLKQRVFSFAEKYYADDKAGEKWNAEIRNLDIQKRLNRLLEDLQDDCYRRLENFRSNLPKNSLGNIYFNADGVKGDDPWDVRFGMGLGAIAIPLLVTGFFSGLIAMAAYSIFTGLITDSKDEKIKKRKAALREQLYYWIDGSGSLDINQKKSISPFLPQIRQQVEKSYRNILKAFEETEKYYFQMQKQFKMINNKQILLASQLNKNLYDINDKLIQKAREHIIRKTQNDNIYFTNSLFQMGQKKFKESIFRVTRVPGQGNLIVEKSIISDDIIHQIKDLLQENIYIYRENEYVSRTSGYYTYYTKEKLINLLGAYGYRDYDVIAQSNIIYIKNKAQKGYNALIKMKGPLSEKQKTMLDKYRKESNEIRTICALIEQIFNYPIREMEE